MAKSSFECWSPGFLGTGSQCGFHFSKNSCLIQALDSDLASCLDDDLSLKAMNSASWTGLS